jgi:hypothetical protein
LSSPARHGTPSPPTTRTPAHGAKHKGCRLAYICRSSWTMLGGTRGARVSHHRPHAGGRPLPHTHPSTHRRASVAQTNMQIELKDQPRARTRERTRPGQHRRNMCDRHRHQPPHIRHANHADHATQANHTGKGTHPIAACDGHRAGGLAPSGCDVSCHRAGDIQRAVPTRDGPQGAVTAVRPPAGLPSRHCDAPRAVKQARRTARPARDAATISSPRRPTRPRGTAIACL